MKFLLNILFLTVATWAFSQCPDPSRFCVGAEGKQWSYNSQSKSAAFEKGDSYTMSFVAYSNTAYNIGVCTMLLDDQKVEFEIYTMVTKKNESTGIYEKEKKYLYRNSEDDLSQTCVIAGERTAKIFVKLRVPVGESKDKENQMNDLLCVGVLIEQAKNIRTGF